MNGEKPPRDQHNEYLSEEKLPDSQEEDREKRERINRILLEAAARYQENHERGEVGIGFLTDSGDTWFVRGRVASVTDEAVVFAEGDRFPLRYVKEVEPLDD